MCLHGSASAAKVIAAFAAMLCCTIGVGLFSLERLDAVNTTAAAIRDTALPMTRTLGDLAYHTMRVRQLEATYALAPDAAARSQESASIRNVGTQAKQAVDAFQALALSGEHRRAADRMEQQWAAYLALEDKFLPLAGTEMVAAVTLYRGEMRTLFNQFQEVLQADIALKCAKPTPPPIPVRRSALRRCAGCSRCWCWPRCSPSLSFGPSFMASPLPSPSSPPRCGASPTRHDRRARRRGPRR